MFKNAIALVLGLFLLACGNINQRKEAPVQKDLIGERIAAGRTITADQVDSLLSSLPESTGERVNAAIVRLANSGLVDCKGFIELMRFGDSQASNWGKAHGVIEPGLNKTCNEWLEKSRR